MIPYEHTAGIGWARFFGWTSLGLGAGALATAFLAPLGAEVGNAAVVAFFGGFAIWFGLMARERYRAVPRRVSWFAVLGTVLGIVTMTVMSYAMIAFIVADATATVWPMAPNWVAIVPGGAPGVAV